MKIDVDRKKIFTRLKSKYFIAGIAFFLWIGLFDDNSLLERKKLVKELKQLEHDMEYYSKEKDITANRLNELQTNNDNLEKFAREQYLMHRDDEDVFVIVKEKK